MTWSTRLMSSLHLHPDYPGAGRGRGRARGDLLSITRTVGQWERFSTMLSYMGSYTINIPIGSRGPPARRMRPPSREHHNDDVTITRMMPLVTLDLKQLDLPSFFRYHMQLQILKTNYILLSYGYAHWHSRTQQYKNSDQPSGLNLEQKGRVCIISFNSSHQLPRQH